MQNSGSEDEQPVGHFTNRGSKRKRPKRISNREKDQRARNSATDLFLRIWKRPCNHPDTSSYQCKKLTIPQLIKAKAQVYDTSNRTKQNEKISCLLEVKCPARRRCKDEAARKHAFSVKYYIATGNERLLVCAAFFGSVFEMKTRRLITIARGVFTGVGHTEMRGGKREHSDFQRKKAEVKAFISSLRVNESHYSRARTKRLYLSSELSVAKLHSAYNKKVDDEQLKVSYNYFYKIFTENFNISFGNPATDVCSTCERLASEKEVAKKKNDENLGKTLRRELKFHKAKAAGFYAAMKKKDSNSISLSFDLQQKPLKLGADVVIYSLTKYMNGHCDVLMGAAVLNDDETYEELKFLQNSAGIVPSPFDCYLVNRSLKTLKLRMKEHMATGLKVARFLESHPAVERVLHPGLKSHPGYDIAKRQWSGCSGMLSFYIKGGIEESKLFLKTLKFFQTAESLGGYESLAEIPSIMTHASVPSDVREHLQITDNLIRLSVGLEAAEDLISDLNEALTATLAL